METVKTIIRINPDGETLRGLTPVTHESSDTPIEGARSPTAHIAYSYKDGHFNSGVWACDAGTLKIENLPVHEVCFLIEGIVEITDENGNTEIFNAGDAFILPKGFSGTWHMPVHFKKFNAIYCG